MPTSEKYKLKKQNRYISPHRRRSDTDINRLLILKTNKEIERHMRGYNRSNLASEDREVPQTPEIFRSGARGPFQLYKPEDFGLLEAERFKNPKEVFEGLEYEPRDTPRGILKAARYKKENFLATPKDDLRTPTTTNAPLESNHLQKQKKNRKKTPDISDRKLSVRKQLLLQRLNKFKEYHPKKLDFYDSPSTEIEPENKAVYNRFIYTELPSPSSGEISILDESEMRTDDVFGSDHIGDIDILPKPPSIEFLEKNEILHDSQMNNDDLFASDNVLEPNQAFLNKPNIDAGNRNQRITKNDQKNSKKNPNIFFQSLLYMFQPGTHLSSSSENDNKNIHNNDQHEQISLEFPEGEFFFLENLEEDLNTTLGILLEKDMPFEDIFGKSDVEEPFPIVSNNRRHFSEYLEEHEKLEEVSFPQINLSEVKSSQDERTPAQKQFEEIRSETEKLHDFHRYIAEIENNLLSERSLLDSDEGKYKKSLHEIESEQKHSNSLPRPHVVSKLMEKAMTYFEPDSSYLSVLRNRFRILRGLDPEESINIHSEGMTSKALNEESEPLEMASGYNIDHHQTSRENQDASFHFKGISFSDAKQLDQESFPQHSIYSEEDLSGRQFPNILKDNLSIIDVDDLIDGDIFGSSQILSPKKAFKKIHSSDIHDLRDRFKFLKDFANHLNISSDKNNRKYDLYPDNGIPPFSEDRNLSSESAPFLVENSLPKYYTLPLGQNISKIYDNDPRIPNFPRTFSRRSQYPIDIKRKIGRTSILPHETNFKWLPNYLPFSEQIREHKEDPQSSRRESRIPKTRIRTPRDLRI